ncbi:MAG TPA: TonB-dependent receptor [Salinibacter sp.]|nr:TonB-dependent receptor [Salinibacter sp.]
MDSIRHTQSLALGVYGFALLFVLLLYPPSVHAQEGQGETGTLRGKVIDDETGKPLQGATVALWEESASDSTLVNGIVTGADGQFSFEELPREPYTLRVSFVGYADRRFPDTRPKQDAEAADLGTIRLVPETTRAGEVEVTADRPAAQIQTDRTVYNTSERAVTTGGTAQEVLGNLPSVQIDTDGSISYRGNESVAIHINGEPASLQGESLISYLRSLPAGAVERVEIIPNPSAKYEPEGMAGIINIVLQRDVESGWGGGFTTGTRADANGRYGGNGSVNVGYQSSGLRFVTTYSYRRGEEEDSDQRFVEQFINGPEPADNRLVDQIGTEEELERSHSLTSRVNYSFTEATSLAFEGTFSLRRDESSGRNLERRYTGSLNATPDSTNVRLLNEDSGDETVDGRLSFDHAFVEDEHTIEAQLQYDRDFENEDNSYGNYAFLDGNRAGDPRSRESDDVGEDEQEGSFELDYARPLGGFEMEAGYKGNYRRLESSQQFRRVQGGILAELQNSDFTFDEQVHAAYGILRRDLGDFSVEGGLRAEAVNTTIDVVNGNQVDNDYISLYPSAFLTYKPSERRQARLSYSKRVDRPGLWDINPIEDNENPTFRERGNPNLDPEYIHSFELTATQRLKGASFTVTPYVRHTVNEIEEIERDTTIGGQQVIIRQAQNFSSSTSYGTELVSTFSWNDRIEGTLSGNVYRSVTDGSNLSTDLSNDALTYSVRGNVRGEVWNGLSLELSQYYRPATDIPGGRMDRFTNTEVALQQQLFGGDGSLTFRVDGLFNANQFNVRRRTDNFYQESTFQWGAREFSLTFQYTFGMETSDRGGGGRGYDGGGPGE